LLRYGHSRVSVSRTVCDSLLHHTRIQAGTIDPENGCIETFYGCPGKKLVAGSIDAFAAWRVEARTENQLLMSDFSRRTRSWLMVVPAANASCTRTRLYFGSAVVPVKNSRTGRLTLGLGFRALLGFHRLYSVVLLYAAKSRLEAQYSLRKL